ncbi:MAG: type II toxin-antitoxin system VapC family toxin [Bacteroidales bacterium]|nr:type II toxin-antitoxin system VapC family toxin [Bacteroidales bacterium]
MGKSYLIDTNAVIDYLNNNLPPQANQLIDSFQPKISIISRLELLSWHGANEKQLEVLAEFINSSMVFLLEETVILKTIEIRKTFRLKLPDAIIAATALVNELILLTRNTKDFKDISALEIVNPHEILANSKRLE